MQSFVMKILAVICVALSCNAWGGTFTTALSADTSAPVLTVAPLAQLILDDSATIIWSTDRRTDSRVYFGAAQPLVKVAGEIEFASVHSVKLTKLLADTTYLYQVVSVDPKGNKTTSSVSSFHTSVQGKTTPLINWPVPATISYGTALSAIQLNASATVAGNFTYTPAAGAVLSAGLHALSANFVPNDIEHYNPVLGSTVTLNIGKADQTIGFANPGAQYLGTSPTLPASASSGLVPTYTSVTGEVCTITPAGKLTLNGLGTCTIQVDQAGNGNYRAAAAVRNAFSVLAAVTAPSAGTMAATAIGSSGATLNGVVNANGAGTAVSFDYGPTTGYGFTVAATPPALASGAGSTVSLVVSGLSCNANYHFRVSAVNSAGTTKGGDLGFTTSACSGNVPGAPIINAATPGSGQAKLSFAAPANNGGNAITAYIATCTANGRPARSANGAGSPITVSGLMGGATYQCTVVAVNANGSGPASSARAVMPRAAGLGAIFDLLLD